MPGFRGLGPRKTQSRAERGATWVEGEGSEVGGPRVMAVDRMIVCAGWAAVELTWS